MRVELALAVRPAGERTEVAVYAEITGPPTAGPLGHLIGRAVRGDLRRSAAALAGLIG